MTPAVVHVLLALAGGERHGYAILKDVQLNVGSRLRFGPGTIYGTLQRLMEAGWVEEVAAPGADVDQRRRYYRMTRAGREALEDGGGQARGGARRRACAPHPASGIARLMLWLPNTRLRSMPGCIARHSVSVPASFAGSMATEMACDFDEARGEVASAGVRAVWVLRLLMGLDLARTIVAQWLRTGLPAIGCVALVCSLVVSAGLASAVRRLTFRIPADGVDAESVGVALLSVVVLMVIVVTIVFNLWVHRPRRVTRR